MFGELAPQTPWAPELRAALAGDLQPIESPLHLLHHLGEERAPDSWIVESRLVDHGYELEPRAWDTLNRLAAHLSSGTAMITEEVLAPARRFVPELRYQNMDAVERFVSRFFRPGAELSREEAPDYCLAVLSLLSWMIEQGPARHDQWVAARARGESSPWLDRRTEEGLVLRYRRDRARIVTAGDRRRWRWLLPLGSRILAGGLSQLDESSSLLDDGFLVMEG